MNAAPEAAAAHGAAGFDPGVTILHHILDSHVLEIPFTHARVRLPRLELLGVDLSITKHVVTMWIAAALLFALARAAARRAREPAPRRVHNLVEVFVVFIRDEVARRAMGHAGDRYLPYLLTTFGFILICNLLGLVPGMATATGNLSVTAGLALGAFVMIHWGGIRQHGLWGHVRHLAPPGLPVGVLPVVALGEFIGMWIKPFALCIRLFANMLAGHIVILAFIFLIFILREFWFVVAPLAVGFALFVHLLEILVAFIQAYIFTMLTAQFIGMSVRPAH